MTTFVDFVFFSYIFISLYMVSLLLLIYLPNRKNLFNYPQGKTEPVSVVIPCYNAEKNIGKTIEAVLSLDYPKDMIEVIVVDDKSTDNSAKVVQEYARKYENVSLIINKRNSGGAAEPTNIGIKAAKYGFVAVTDDDSSPAPDALMKMIGFLQEDKKVGAVSCSVIAREPKTFMQKLQRIEYTIIAWNRKLLDLVDAVYVTPGPFALYRKDILFEIGLFDTKNMTQDIEIVWRMLSYGYKARMSLSARVYSETPQRFRVWWRQRVRWNIGGTQCIIKYKRLIFRKGILGAFIVPFFSANLFLGLFGLSLFIYLLSRRILVFYLSTKYSLYASATIIRFQELTFSPSILNYFGAVLFIFGLTFTFIGLGIMSEQRLGKKNIFNIMFYIVVYLSVYPTIMVSALYKLARGKYSW